MIKTLKWEAKAIIVPVAQGEFLEVPPLLLVLESCFLDDIDCSHLLVDVPVNVLMQWESELSSILKNGLAKMNWWEKQFQQCYPATYERCLLLGGGTVDHAHRWKTLSWMLWRSDHVDRRVWKETLSANSIAHAVRVGGDEFGSNELVYQLLYKENNALPVLRSFTWGLLSGDSETQSYFDFSHQWVEGMFVRQMWSVGGAGDMCLLLENGATGGQELLLLVDKSMDEKQRDLRCWSLNRNVFVEKESDFVLPIRLDGGGNINNQSDVMLKRDEPILVAATVGGGGGCFVVVLAGRVVLVFGQQKQQKRQVKPTMETWRNLLTDQFVEPVRATSDMVSVITTVCFVLDAFLLVASNDGVLRAHPRSNPKSEYFVENVHSLVSQMTSLFNVVAIIHSYCTLEVRRVFRMADDPFVGFDLLYRYHGVDSDHAPLLYGPYVIFAGLDGVWYRVLYDGFCSTGQEREEIKVPHRAGWKIMAVKNANWKYLTVVVRDPIKQVVEELFLFVA